MFANLNILMFALLPYLLCDTVTGSLIYSHKILEILCSIPRSTNSRIIVRAPSILSSVSPILSGVYDPVGSICQRMLLLLSSTMLRLNGQKVTIVTIFYELICICLLLHLVLKYHCH
jgi:hypothetical protein